MSFAAAVCSGTETEVPVRLDGWPAEDAAWLGEELGGWMSARDRQACTARDDEPGVTVELAPLEVIISFDFHGRRRTRSLSRESDSNELFRYQVAAATEELVRSTWEAPPPPRFEVFARGEVSPLGTGPVFLGGAVGGALFVVPSLALELAFGGAGSVSVSVPTGGAVSSTLLHGTVSASWLPLRAGSFRFGPRASLDAGALLINVTESGTTTSGTAPWLALGAGATVGLETRHFSVQLLGEVGFAVLGASVQAEGVPVLGMRGLRGTVGVQAGWLW